MLFQCGHDAAHHHHALGLGRLLDLHHLEAAGQSGIFLEVLLVLRPGRGGDGAQLAARQRRLEQVGGIVLSGLSAGADHGVRFVDEQNDRSGRRFHFLDQSLQPVFEFALHAGAGLQQSQIERANGYVLQSRRNVALGDAQRESLDHGRLSDARFAGEDGVVLPAPRQDVDDLADFEIAAQNRVDLALAGILGQVDGVLIEVRSLVPRPV